MPLVRFTWTTALGYAPITAYFTYLGNIAQGHFGISLTFFPDTVAHQVLQALPWTLALVGITTIIAFVLGTAIGLVSAWRRGTALDGALPPLFVITSAFPYFWLALLAIWLFSIKLGWLPESGGYDVTTVPSGLAYPQLGSRLVAMRCPSVSAA